jgi:insulysin
MLIQDTKTEKSSAVMNVAVGSMQNPKEVPGLAHFLEHMLFMGNHI